MFPRSPISQVMTSPGGTLASNRGQGGGQEWRGGELVPVGVLRSGGGVAGGGALVGGDQAGEVGEQRLEVSCGDITGYSIIDRI